MKTSVKVSTPKKATIYFSEYMDRGTQKAMRRVISKHSSVDMQEAQKKFTAIKNQKDESKRIKMFQKISHEEQEAVFDLQEAMVKGMIIKIEVSENGENIELDENKFSKFLDRMKETDFAELSLLVSSIVEKNRESEEKKTK